MHPSPYVVEDPVRRRPVRSMSLLEVPLEMVRRGLGSSEVFRREAEWRVSDPRQVDTEVEGASVCAEPWEAVDLAGARAYAAPDSGPREVNEAGEVPTGHRRGGEGDDV